MQILSVLNNCKIKKYEGNYIYSYISIPQKLFQSHLFFFFSLSTKILPSTLTAKSQIYQLIFSQSMGKKQYADI